MISGYWGLSAYLVLKCFGYCSDVYLNDIRKTGQNKESGYSWFNSEPFEVEPNDRISIKLANHDKLPAERGILGYIIVDGFAFSTTQTHWWSIPKYSFNNTLMKEKEEFYISATSPTTHCNFTHSFLGILTDVEYFTITFQVPAEVHKAQAIFNRLQYNALEYRATVTTDSSFTISIMNLFSELPNSKLNHPLKFTYSTNPKGKGEFLTSDGKILGDQINDYGGDWISYKKNGWGYNDTIDFVVYKYNRYVDSNQGKVIIVVCGKGCEKCTGDDLCTECKSSYFKAEDIDNQCFSEKEIADNYFFSNNFYFKCHETCGKCSDESENSCEQCSIQYPYSITNGEKKSCYRDCDESDNKFYNYEIDKEIDIECVGKCEEEYPYESSEGGVCLSYCPEEEYKDENKCVKFCPNDKKYHDDKQRECTECGDKIIEDELKCVEKCFENGLYDNNKKCIKKCPQFFKKDDDDELTCIPECETNNKIYMGECLSECNGILEDDPESPGYCKSKFDFPKDSNGNLLADLTKQEIINKITNEKLPALKDLSSRGIVICKDNECLLQVYLLDNPPQPNNIVSDIDLSEVIAYYLSTEEYSLRNLEAFQAYVVKMDYPRSTLPTSQVEYMLFDTSYGEKMERHLGEQLDVKIKYVVNTEWEELNFALMKNLSLANDLDDIYYSGSSFYNEMCLKFSNANGRDITYKQRIDLYTNITLCEKHCEYKGEFLEYDKILCECAVKEFNTDVINDNFDEVGNNNKVLIITEQVKTYFFMFKCVNNFGDGILTNIGFWFSTIIMVTQWIVITTSLCFEFVKVNVNIAQLLSSKFAMNPPKKRGGNPDDMEGQDDNEEENVNNRNVKIIKDYYLHNKDKEVNNNNNNELSNKYIEGNKNYQFNNVNNNYDVSDNNIPNNDSDNENDSISNNDNIDQDNYKGTDNDSYDVEYNENLTNKNNEIGIINTKKYYDDQGPLEKDFDYFDYDQRFDSKLNGKEANKPYGVDDNKIIINKLSDQERENKKLEKNSHNWDEMSKEPSNTHTKGQMFMWWRLKNDVQSKIGSNKAQKKLNKLKNIEQLLLDTQNFSGYENPLVLIKKEIDNENFDIALSEDKRSFCEILWSYFKEKNLLLKAINTKSIFEWKLINVSLFILHWFLWLTFNCLLYTMYTIEQYNHGTLNPAIDIIRELLSVFFAFLVVSLFQWLMKYDHYFNSCFIEVKNVEVMAKGIKKWLRKLRLSVIIYLTLQTIIIIFFWFFITLFCQVYSGNTMNWFIGFAMSVMFSLLFSLISGLLYSSFRRCALTKNNKKAYYFAECTRIIT